MISPGRKFQFQRFALHNSTIRQHIIGTTFRTIRRSTSCDKESAAIQRYKSTNLQLSLTVHDYLIHIIIAMGGLFCLNLQLKQIITHSCGLDPSVILHISIGTGKACETQHILPTQADTCQCRQLFVELRCNTRVHQFDFPPPLKHSEIYLHNCKANRQTPSRKGQ